jgi:hypothetical protein
MPSALKISLTRRGVHRFGCSGRLVFFAHWRKLSNSVTCPSGVSIHPSAVSTLAGT